MFNSRIGAGNQSSLYLLPLLTRRLPGGGGDRLRTLRADLLHCGTIGQQLGTGEASCMWEEKESYPYLSSHATKTSPTAARTCTDSLCMHTEPVIANCNTGLHTAHPPCSHPIILLVSPYGRGLLPVSPDFHVSEAHGTQPHLPDAKFLGHLVSTLLHHPTPNCLSKLSQAPNPSFPCPHSARGLSGPPGAAALHLGLSVVTQ